MPPKRIARFKFVNHRGPNADFQWASCGDQTHPQRIKIKEEGVRLGLSQAERVAVNLRDIVHHADIDADPKTWEAIGGDDLENWLHQFDKISSEHRTYKAYAGVAGPTGAGKTALLSALLGHQDILPSSNEEAATAVVCCISYNDDDDDERAFRAEIIFNSVKELCNMLDGFFEDLTLRSQLQAEIEAEDGEKVTGTDWPVSEASEDVEHELRASEDNLREVSEMIKAVWGLDEKQLELESTQSLLSRNPDVLQLLNQGSLDISRRNVEEFSTAVRPYMNSSEALHGKSGQQFAAWPLIKQVNIFVKSDILKTGLTLVDLPGLGDNVESRAAVAEKYFSELSFTIIVTPSVRAANESTSVRLMTENQELEMKMDGRFHKKSFCVVLSKMDDITVSSYLKDHRKDAIADKISEIDKQRAADQCKLTEIERTYQHENKTVVYHRKAFRSAKRKIQKLKKDGIYDYNVRNDHHKAREEARRAQEDGEVHQKEMRKLSKHARYLRVNIAGLKSQIKYWCMRNRYKVLKSRILKDFECRQKRLALLSKAEIYDGKVDILPVSSTAFWQLTNETEKPEGFPNIDYTGIPQLANWLRIATSQGRERHLDMMLNSLSGLFNGIQTWSSDEWEGAELRLTKNSIENIIMEVIDKHLTEKLGGIVNGIVKQVKKIDPLRHGSKKKIIDECKRTCPTVVASWGLKYPDDPSSKERIEWSTYGACINKYGRPFTSRGRKRVRHCWLEKFGSALLKQIAEQWEQAFHQELPGLKGPACGRVEKIWEQFLNALLQHVCQAQPELEACLVKEMLRLAEIRKEVQDMLAKKLQGISFGARRVRSGYKKFIASKWEATFDRARAETGRGHFKRRQAIIRKFAEKGGKRIYEDSWQMVDQNLKGNLKLLPGELGEVKMFATTRVREQISLMLNNVLASETNQWGADEKETGKTVKQAAVRSVLAEWALYWRVGFLDEEELTCWDLKTEIPEDHGAGGDGDEEDAMDVDFDLEGPSSGEENEKEENDDEEGYENDEDE